jgi:hypothetical protein
MILQKLQKKDEKMKQPLNLDDDELAGASAQNEEHMEDDDEDEDGRKASVLPKWI